MKAQYISWLYNARMRFGCSRNNVECYKIIKKFVNNYTNSLAVNSS